MTLRRPERAYRAFATKSGGWGQSGKALRVASSVCASPSKGADHEEGGLERRLRRSASKDRSLLPEKPESCRRYTSCILPVLSGAPQRQGSVAGLISHGSWGRGAAH